MRDTADLPRPWVRRPPITEREEGAGLPASQRLDGKLPIRVLERVGEGEGGTGSQGHRDAHRLHRLPEERLTDWGESREEQGVCCTARLNRLLIVKE